MLTEYLNEHARELRELEHSRPRYDRVERRRRSRFRDVLRGLALTPAKATPSRAGSLPDVLIRPAAAKDGQVLARLAEASERRMPSGLVLVAEVETQVVAALPMEDGHVLSDLFRPTGDIVQLLELRSEQLRAARFERVA